MKTNYEIALDWEAANFDRTMQLNDMLDACPNYKAKQELWASFTEEEKNGLIPEYLRRIVDKEAPVGSLVKPEHPQQGITLISHNGRSTIRVTYFGLALVIGSAGHGDRRRYVMVHPFLQNNEGQMIIFAEASCSEMEVVG